MAQRSKVRQQALRSVKQICPVCGKDYDTFKSRNWGDPVHVEVKRGKRITLQRMPAFVTRTYDCGCKQTIDVVTGEKMVG